MEHKPPALQRFGWLPGVATILAIAACYGTVLVITALSLLGITLVVHEGVWAGAISVFALLAVVGMALGYLPSWPPVHVQKEAPPWEEIRAPSLGGACLF
ncbi:MAG: hypothetical protein OES46_16175 [Gammaproteobacteria bacterium]|jgi:hypothetical protein|nr:hypothetical protein [Gammaproteobacteria bacterium]